jgi:O-antigen biosynthesis protein
MYRVKNEERWIQKSLESISDLCSKIVILDDGSTDNTVEVCQSFSNVVDIYQQKDLQIDEHRDRTRLLKMALDQDPDYLLTMDGDEVILPTSKDILLEEINVLYPQKFMFQFQFLYMWDKFNQYRYDGLYSNIWQNRLMKIKGQSKDLSFKTSKYGSNFHMGSLPSNTIDYENSIKSNVKILHYGYFDQKLRETKFEFYSKNDPNSEGQDGYKHIISGNGQFSGPHGMEFKTLLDEFTYENL